MRCDQYIGLNEWAKKKVLATRKVREVGHRIYSDGRAVPFQRKTRVPVARIQVIGKIEGAWTPVVANLHRYTLPGGEVYEEYVQATPWSGGPCYFVALKDAKGEPVPQSLWSDEDLAHC
jgi:hypothetical protein